MTSRGEVDPEGMLWPGRQGSVSPAAPPLTTGRNALGATAPAKRLAADAQFSLSDRGAPAMFAA